MYDTSRSTETLPVTVTRRTYYAMLGALARDWSRSLPNALTVHVANIAATVEGAK